MHRAVIMAGGKGRRLLPLTERLPKAMVPIDDRPILEFVLAALNASGFREILVVLQHLPAAIVRHFGDGSRFGVRIDYLLQDGDLGTAGSVRQAMEVFDDEDFLVASSDLLFHGDLMPGLELHLAHQSTATLALTRVDDVSRFGAAGLGEDGRLVSFREKPGSSEEPPDPLVNAGIYFLNRRALERLPPDRFVDFGLHLFPRLVADGEPVYGWQLPGYWRDVGTRDALESARRDLREIPSLAKLITRWPSARSGNGGRIWMRDAGSGWLSMDCASVCGTAALLWNHLAGGRDKACTVEQLQQLEGVVPKEVSAALGWLAREGKVRFIEGRSPRVELTPRELEAMTS